MRSGLDLVVSVVAVMPMMTMMVVMAMPMPLTQVDAYAGIAVVAMTVMALVVAMMIAPLAVGLLHRAVSGRRLAGYERGGTGSAACCEG
jgi:hypothetical protein